MSPKRTFPKIYDIEYFVVWLSHKRVFEANCEGLPLGNTPHKAGAIAHAKAHAEKNKRVGQTVVIYSYTDDGRLITEWSA
jgi:hypothetical protein